MALLRHRCGATSDAKSQPSLLPAAAAVGAAEVLAGTLQNDIGHALPDHVVVGIDGTAAALGLMPAFVLDDLGDVGKLAVDKLGFAAHERGASLLSRGGKRSGKSLGSGPSVVLGVSSRLL